MRQYIFIFQASDSAWDGTKTHPSSLPEVLELLFCRSYGGADGIGMFMVIGIDAGTGIDIGILVPGDGCGCKLFVGGGGGGLEFIRINSNCRLRFAWNFNNSSCCKNNKTKSQSENCLFSIKLKFMIRPHDHTFSITLLHSSSRSFRSLGSIFDKISSRCFVTYAISVWIWY